MMRKLGLLLLFLFVFAGLVSAQEARHFTFHYAFTVRNVPAGERVRIWILARNQRLPGSPCRLG